MEPERKARPRHDSLSGTGDNKRKLFFEVSYQAKVLFLEGGRVVLLLVLGRGGGGGGQRLLTLGSHWSVGLSGRRERQ